MHDDIVRAIDVLCLHRWLYMAALIAIHKV